VREVLRLWCCRGFLPLWVGMLPMDVVHGAWQLLLEAEEGSLEDDEALQAPSTANLAIALALLRRCVGQVLDSLAETDDGEDDGGLSAYAALVQASQACYGEPETLMRDVMALELSPSKVAAARSTAWAERQKGSVARTPTSFGRGQALSHVLTLRRYDLLRAHLVGEVSEIVDEIADEGPPNAAQTSVTPSAAAPSDAVLTAAAAPLPRRHSFSSLGKAVDQTRLLSSMQWALGRSAAAEWHKELHHALGARASLLQVLTALASQVRVGLLERLSIIFELHAGSRDARLGVRELHYLTQSARPHDQCIRTLTACLLSSSRSIRERERVRVGAAPSTPVPRARSPSRSLDRCRPYRGPGGREGTLGSRGS